MTLIILCYICGQGEKVRLTMRMLLIVVTTYVSFFSLGIQSNQVYAMDIAVTQSQATTGTSLTPTIVVETEVVIEKEAAVETSTQEKTEKEVEGIQPTDTYSKTSIEKSFEKVMMLKTVFPDHEIFSGNTYVLLDHLVKKLSNRSEKSQVKLLKKVHSYLKTMDKEAHMKYGIEAHILLPVLDLAIIQYENTITTVTTDGVSSGSPSSSYQGVFNKFVISTIDEDIVHFSMKEGERISRLNLYVNDSFVRSCEGDQCNSFTVYARTGDTIRIYTAAAGNVTQIDEYSL